MLAQAYNLIPLPYKAEVSAATVVPLADEAGLSMEYRLYQGTDIQGLQASGLSSGEVKLAVCIAMFACTLAEIYPAISEWFSGLW